MLRFFQIMEREKDEGVNVEDGDEEEVNADREKERVGVK